MSEDNSIHRRITDAIEEERKLRAELGAGRITEQSEHARIGELEAELDQLWDLLRQRQAQRDAGQDPNAATIRSVEQVEGYDA